MVLGNCKMKPRSEGAGKVPSAELKQLDGIGLFYPEYRHVKLKGHSAYQLRSSGRPTVGTSAASTGSCHKMAFPKSH
jgi:hypothetical protein